MLNHGELPESLRCFFFGFEAVYYLKIFLERIKYFKSHLVIKPARL